VQYRAYEHLFLGFFSTGINLLAWPDPMPQQQIVKKILQHLDLWHVKRKPPAQANDPPAQAIIIFDDSSVPDAEAYLIDADRTTMRLSAGYPIETYL
jgi:hypothetical protein